MDMSIGWCENFAMDMWERRGEDGQILETMTAEMAEDLERLFPGWRRPWLSGAMLVPKPPPVPAGQVSLFDLDGEAS